MNTDTEYSTEFDKLRKNRVEVSFYKYGAARDNFGSGRVDAIGSLELCLEKFKKTGNTEYLLDVANYAMFRYMFPLPGEYFKATDSSESAGTVGIPTSKVQKTPAGQKKAGAFCALTRRCPCMVSHWRMVGSA